VRIIADQEFASLIIAHGLEFFPTGVDARSFVETYMGGLMHERNPLQLMRRWREVRPLMREGEQQQAQAQWKAVQDATAIIGHVLFTPFGLTMAEKLSIPYIEVDVKPMVPTREYPLTILPKVPFGGGFNRFSHLLFEKIMWQMQRATINKWRLNQLELLPLPFRGYHRHLENSLSLRLCGISPHVIPRPDDWPEHVHMTGYLHLFGTIDYQPPADLVAFLTAGPPPVYIGFGSMPSQDPTATTQMMVQALQQAGQRGILLGGWGGMAKTNLPDTVFHIDSVPHDWLFPQTAAVVHHGGAGTTAAGLRFGVPSIIVPLMGDQPFWGRQVHQLGVGPKPIPRRQITAEKLALAIRQAINDSTMQQKAAALGQKLRAEYGPATAAGIIKRQLTLI